MNKNNQTNQPIDPPGPCTVGTTPLTPFENLAFFDVDGLTTIKVPVVTAAVTIQIPLETTITLTPAATEIKRVKKNVFLDQVKLVPTSFDTSGPHIKVTAGKLFIAGHIRKNIEYTSSGTTGGAGCTTALLDRVVDINFNGFTEITRFATPPIIDISASDEANFLSETNNLNPRLDKYLFRNTVEYNEQPFGELVSAAFIELDFSPNVTAPEAPFSTLTEKLVLELTLKVLQIQQVQVVTPGSGTSGLTPSASDFNVTEEGQIGTPTVGRNDRCPCGSGRKYRKCCGK